MDTYLLARGVRKLPSAITFDESEERIESCRVRRSPKLMCPLF